MSKAKQPPAEVKPEIVPCPQCSGTGDIVKPTPTPGAAEIRIKSPEVAFMEGQAKTIATARDGWRHIAESLLSVAFSDEMRGFSDVPPTELLVAVQGGDDSNERVCSLRDALIGRAWRVRGSDARGVCDYPLCPTRKERRPLLDVPATFKPRQDAGVLAETLSADYRPARIVMHVCSGPLDNECQAWARWVAARAANGSIQSR